MSSLAMRRAVATALAGATIVSAIGATAASARPMAPRSVEGTVEATSVAPPPSSIAAPAGDAYEELRSPAPGDPQPVVAEASEPSGFDLPSAAIGAATGAGLVIALLAAGGLARRRPLARGHGTIGA
jgi:hypothetical protein